MILGKLKNIGYSLNENLSLPPEPIDVPTKLKVLVSFINKSGHVDLTLLI